MLNKNRFHLKKKALLSFALLFGLSGFSQINTTKRIYEIWDDQPAPNRGKDYSLIQARGYPADPDWEAYSYPIGNGYMGANVFGRTDVERIQLTEKTLANEGLYGKGGLTSFAEIYLDFGHYHPENYKRSLNLNDAILCVEYEHEGVKYSREYFGNYPENVIAVKIDANKEGKISFRLHAEIPYRRSENEINTRTGKTKAEDDLITLTGNIAHFNVNYEAQIKVINDGGRLYASNNNRNAEIRIEQANSVIILIAAGTNYELKPHIFLEKTHAKKLDGTVFPHEKVSRRIERASNSGYDKLKQIHLEDYQLLFSRVNVILSPEVPELTTEQLLESYKKDNTNPYLEELLFQFGRYLLISSSRKGTLPSGLQGVWSQYLVTPWTGGYWHNINVQMNYWGAFNTNLAETFIPYIEYHKAYLPRTKEAATDYIQKNNPQALDSGGDNGWAIGSGSTAYVIGGAPSHSGPGTAGFTSKLFWEYFDFTRDTSFLRDTGYPALLGASKFLSKTVKPAGDGLLLVDPSASPEVRVRDENGGYSGDHYRTIGTTFDQGFVWENHNDVLKAAQILGEENEFLELIRDQMKQLDPILIGASGQIKEYREENKYAEIGDPHHRHISQLCPLFPGTLINSNTPEWLEAARVTLDYRGNKATGWGLAHRQNLRARTKDAEKTHEVLRILLKERTLPNLWTVHPPFQIDANLGLVSGIAEMLVQSHEGYIELLPSLPDEWNTGEFNGLVARGNFELSAKWATGKLLWIEIISKAGGVCKLKYPNPGKIQILDPSGQVIPFTEEAGGIIKFNTLKFEKYTVSLND